VDTSGDDGMGSSNSSITKAKRAYEKALAVEGIDSAQESLVYLKLGNLYGEKTLKWKKAKEYWDKAVKADPECESGKLAALKLASSK
jgi:tetratricopeptide (TPR) repeat protein